MRTITKIALPGDSTKFLNGQGEFVTLAPAWGSVLGQIHAQEDFIIVVTQKALEAVREALEAAWPVSSYFFTDINLNPGVRLRFGTWELVAEGNLLMG